MTQMELVIHGIGLVILFVLVAVKAHFWLCASPGIKEPPDIDDDNG